MMTQIYDVGWFFDIQFGIKKIKKVRTFKVNCYFLALVAYRNVQRKQTEVKFSDYVFRPFLPN